MTKRDFIKAHPVGGWCLSAPTKPKTPMLRFGALDLPVAVDNRQYCTAIEDQGSKPWCAAYTAAAFAENVMWRRDGKITQVEPDWIYAYAKKHDGSPSTDGTSLDAVLEALRSRKVFDPAECRVRLIHAQDDVEAAIHRFGCVLGGFNITDEWYELSKGGVYAVKGSGAHRSLGGHAVLIVGYDANGVWIENSWGTRWGDKGFGYLSWTAFRQQFMYGAVLTHCLNGFK